jgi:hypothetical protein
LLLAKRTSPLTKREHHINRQLALVSIGYPTLFAPARSTSGAVAITIELFLIFEGLTIRAEQVQLVTPLFSTNCGGCFTVKIVSNQQLAAAMPT